LPSSIGAYNIKKTKKFGKSSLTYYIWYNLEQILL
jgi:hypothetical protein